VHAGPGLRLQPAKSRLSLGVARVAGSACAQRRRGLASRTRSRACGRWLYFAPFPLLATRRFAIRTSQGFDGGGTLFIRARRTSSSSTTTRTQERLASSRARPFPRATRLCHSATRRLPYACLPASRPWPPRLVARIRTDERVPPVRLSGPPAQPRLCHVWLPPDRAGSSNAGAHEVTSTKTYGQVRAELILPL
jgi:hypothetical protein